MADFSTNGDLRFQATNSGGVLTPTSNFTHHSINSAVIDDNSDNDVDGGDYYINSSVGYTGYTIEINGRDYAVFFNGFNSYIVPYHSSIDDLSSLDGTAVTQTITNTGDNAVVVNCFVTGTQIVTPGGQTVVESLRIGDEILDQDGQTLRVKWIGRQMVSTRFGPAERLMPVRFAAGSLGEGLPHSDLTVTADHGMLVDGVICHAGALVNGTTITRVPLEEMGESYTVYHIETEEHEIILANGAPAETFIDNVSRRVFDNYTEFEALYGDVPEMEELPYPRAMSARQVPAWIRRALSAQRVA
jgi:hypothetical protein